jgi:uncharacterized protein YukJ
MSTIMLPGQKEWKPVVNYGVWRVRPYEYRAERAAEDDESPHIYLNFNDESTEMFEAAINIKSGTKGESRLVYWINDKLDASFIKSFKDLPLGWHELEGEKGLDYLRDEGLFVKQDGIVLPHDKIGRNNDIIDKITPYLKRAKEEQATIFIFGSRYEEPPPAGKLRGLHEIHQNQGSLPRYSNSVQKDGAMIFHFEEADPDQQWVGIFLAFASQRMPTDNEKGLAQEPSESWAEILGAGAEKDE